MSSARRVSTRALAAVVLCASLTTASSISGASISFATRSDDTAAEQAAAEIEAARQRADDASQAMFDAESKLDELTLEEEATAAEVAALEAKASQLATDVEELAVRRFISGSQGIPLLSGLDGPTQQAQANVLLAIVTESSQSTLDEYDALADELATKRKKLQKAKERTGQAIADYQALKEKAEAEVKRLQEVEAKRLKDEKVRQILEAKRRAAQANTGGRRSGSSGFLDNGIYFDGSILCPFVGSAGFGDTWGAPRSGGRRHEGVDILTATGTPLVAVVSGRASFSITSLGGNSVTLYGDNGNTYFYAHLSAWEGQSRQVQQGDVVGYVGDTGNATGTPHLHFEIRPNRGRPVNPYPSVRAAC
ncbi:MAG: hypothetical protein RL391_1189 [Actinomycetota bacterium]|jgi:murein DD-endopeptidase MepM/ murein hydrolase activator NlpD